MNLSLFTSKKQKLNYLLGALLFLSGWIYAQNESFIKAQKAYDQGDYPQAIECYETLLSNKTNNIEVSYNLANAYFKAGNFPQAVRYYRRAEYQAPNDPDIKANLSFALNATGATPPKPTLLQRFSSILPTTQWLRTAIIGYILFTLLLILGQLIRPAKRILLKLSLLPAMLILLASAGWWGSQQIYKYPEWVVIKKDATTLYGPIEGTTAHYKIPLAALVTQRNKNEEGWIEIEYDQKIGWIQEKYIHPVSP